MAKAKDEKSAVAKKGNVEDKPDQLPQTGGSFVRCKDTGDLKQQLKQQLQQQTAPNNATAQGDK